MAGPETTGPSAVRARLDETGPFGRPLRRVLQILIEDGATLPALVAATGVPRREVERLLSALGDDARPVEGVIRLAGDEYRALLEPPVRPAAPEHEELAGHSAALAVMRELTGAAPAPQRHLDHVSATAETAVRRALWLDASYDLERAHLLCVGDHDLTSLATALIRPEVEITVVDLDERILEFVDRTARERGWNIHCRWGDFRFGLPTTATGTAQIAFTDPPYTPDGIELFLLRALQGLGDTERGRLVMAYGYGDHQPGLGLKVQEAVQSMHLVFEAILPGFNRYLGAQAIGSRSDLYVCRPTPRTWRALPRLAERADPRIYTHGDQSLEARSEAIGAAAVEALLSPLSPAGAVPPAPGGTTGAPADGDSPSFIDLGSPLVLVGRRWAGVNSEPAETVTVAAAVRGEVGAREGRLRVAADLADDPGPWLLRLLLAVNAHEMTVLIPNAHPDVATGPALSALRELVAAKYLLKVRRSTPDGRSAVVEARATDGIEGSPEGFVGRYLLRHGRGRVGTVARDALVGLNRRHGRTLTRSEARALVQEHVRARPGDLDVPLLEMPRHLLAEMLDAVRGVAVEALAQGSVRSPEAGAVTGSDAP